MEVGDREILSVSVPAGADVIWSIDLYFPGQTGVEVCPVCFSINEEDQTSRPPNGPGTIARGHSVAVAALADGLALVRHEFFKLRRLHSGGLAWATDPHLHCWKSTRRTEVCLYGAAVFLACCANIFTITFSSRITRYEFSSVP